MITARAIVWKFLLIEEDDPPLERLVMGFLLSLIVLSTLGVILSSVSEIESSILGDYIEDFEYFCGSVFTIEYGLRLWSAPEDPHYRGKLGRLKFILSPLAIIDLLAIAPFLLPFFAKDLIMLRSIRLFRLVRLLRIGRYSRAVHMLMDVLRERGADLAMAGFIGLVMLIMASSLMYLAEHEAQPDKFSSIPAAMWWGVATLTTVGYGDVCPVTVLGKIAACLTEIIGIGLFALPAGIIGAGFVDVIQRHKSLHRGTAATVCPNCGQEIG